MNTCIDCPQLISVKNDPDKKQCSKNNNWIFSTSLATNQKLCGTTPTDWTENLTEAKLA